MVKLKELLESSKSDNSPRPKGYAPFVTPEKFQQYKAYLTRIFETSGMKLIKEGVEDKGILKAIFLAGGLVQVKLGLHVDYMVYQKDELFCRWS